MKLFVRNKDIERLAQEKAQRQMSDELARALWEVQLSNGLDLDIDLNRKKYIKAGYEENPDVFGITTKIAGMFSNITIKCFEKGSDTEVDNPLLDFFDNTDSDLTFEEYLMMWELYGLIQGNGIDYIETVTGGNNAGKILNINAPLPPQNVIIESGGWKNPVAHYKLDFNEQIDLKKEFIYHTRLFPNLDYLNGKNFMGISPVKVAASIIKAQNSGYERLSTLLTKGAPPGILSKKTSDFDITQLEQQRKNMEKQWDRKYGSPTSGFKPLFTTGDLNWLTIGISSMKDLQVLESSVAGMRVLCRIWGVPSQAFGDTEQSTYNNMAEAKTAVYEDRLMPDMNRRLAIFNKLLGSDYYNKELKADYSDVPCLQVNLKRRAEILSLEKLNRTITTDEFREDMGRDALSDDQISELGLNDDNLIY